MYMLSFVIGYFVLKRFARSRKLNISTDDLYDLLFYLILGVMIGGRLGYVIFYDLGSYLRNPLSIAAIWQGGMSFHGGFAGVVIATLLVTRKKGWNFWEIADMIWPGFGPYRKFHQCRVVRPSNKPSMGHDLSARWRNAAASIATL